MRGGDRERGEAQCEERPPPRYLGPPAQPDQLLAAGMIFDADEQPRRAENAAPNLQVPAVGLATVEHAGTRHPQPRFQRPQALTLRPPPLAADRRPDRPHAR